MQFLGTLSEVRETVSAARDALGHIERIGNGLRGYHGLGNLPAGVNSAPAGYTNMIDWGDGTQTYDYPNGTSVTYDANGNVQIFNAAGQDVTSSYVGAGTGAPQLQSTGQLIGQSLSDSLSNVATAVTSTVHGLGSALPWVAVGALALAVIYFGSRK